VPHIALTGDGGRVRPEDVDAIEQLVADKGILDGTTGGVLRRLDQLPRSQTPSARQLFGGQLYEPEDDHLATPDELIAEEDARRAERIRRRTGESMEGGTYDGIEECHANHVTHKRGGGKGTGRAKPGPGGESINDENWEHLRADRVRPVVVGARVTIESKEALDADQSVSNGELMESMALLMRRTGRTKAEIKAAIDSWAETGILDPEIADALPPPPTANESAA
jgi:hypothetical protein